MIAEGAGFIKGFESVLSGAELTGCVTHDWNKEHRNCRCAVTIVGNTARANTEPE